jgi:peptide/nickel transport system permease protein
MALPSFFLGALLIAASIALMASSGLDAESLLPFHGFGLDRHLVLPVLVLMIRPAVYIARMTANLLAGESGKQYVVAAKSVGNDWRAIRRRHMLRNVVAPVILTMAGSARLLAAELIVVEWLFGWPGIGRLLAWTLIPPRLTNEVVAPVFLNPPLVATLFTVYAALFLSVDLAAVFLVQVFDPRLRPQAEEIGQEAARA